MVDTTPIAPAPTDVAPAAPTPEEITGKLTDQIIEKSRNDGSFLQYVRKINEKQYGGREDGVLNEDDPDILKNHLEIYGKIDKTSNELANVYSKTLFKEMGGASEQVAQYIKEYLSTEAVERPDNFIEISKQLTEYINLPSQIEAAEKELSKYNEAVFKKHEAEGLKLAADMEQQLEGIGNDSQASLDFLERTKGHWFKGKARGKAEAKLEDNIQKAAVVDNRLDQAKEGVDKCQSVMAEMQTKQAALAEMTKRLDTLRDQFMGVIGPIKQVRTMALEQAREEIMDGFYEEHEVGTGKNRHMETTATTDIDKLTTKMDRHQELTANADLALGKNSEARGEYKTLQDQFRKVLKDQTTEAIASTDFSPNSSLGTLESSLVKFVDATEGKPEERNNLITILEGVRKDMLGAADKDENSQKQKRLALGMMIVDLKRRN